MSNRGKAGQAMYIETNMVAGGAVATSDLSSCANCAIRSSAICKRLSGDALHDFFKRGRRVRLQRGQSLTWEGDAAPAVGNVRSGQLKLTTMLADGRDQILGLALPGDFVGRPFGGRATSTVTALTETALCVFPHAVFDAFVADHPELQHELLLHTLDALDHARRRMILLARKSAGERVASFLLEMADRAGVADGEPAEIVLSRQQMADFLGLTIETVSRKLTVLRQSRAVRLPDLKSFVILNRAALSHAAGGEDRLAA